jgi:hypothetical protein
LPPALQQMAQQMKDALALPECKDIAADLRTLRAMVERDDRKLAA